MLFRSQNLIKNIIGQSELKELFRMTDTEEKISLVEYDFRKRERWASAVLPDDSPIPVPMEIAEHLPKRTHEVFHDLMQLHHKNVDPIEDDQKFSTERTAFLVTACAFGETMFKMFSEFSQPLAAFCEVMSKKVADREYQDMLDHARTENFLPANHPAEEMMR